MSDFSKTMADCHPQQAIRAKCFHPGGIFQEFRREEIEQSISARFEQMVRRYGDRLAIKTKDHSATYNELNKAANRVARAVLDLRGEGPESVAILSEHGIAMIVAILGVLKAGKFYVPLDSSYPFARTTYILNDSQASLIVTDNNNLSLGKEFLKDALDMVNVDDINANLSDEDPGVSISPDALAWIHYTSGSTGQPKGVMQNHRNVMHFIMNYTNGLRICADDRLAHVNRGIQDILSALLKGAVVCPLDTRKEGLTRVGEWLIREEITVYHSFPTLFRHFVHTLTGNVDFPRLRVICLEGEPVQKRDVELYQKYFSPTCIFVNRLGGTEARSIRWNFIDKDTRVTDSVVPVGYAFEDTQVLLLGDDDREVDINCIGEIAIKSRYLSPGYWRKPDLTQARFFPDPNGTDERIYRTGDLGRMLPDGCLEHLGRKDFQVKVRGYRIEVAEIETALLDLAAIKEAAVVAGGDEFGDTRLVAYVVPTRNPAPNVSELRDFLKERLPDYMIPSNYMFLDALPLTPNGKLDRKALPELGTSRPDLDTAFVMSRTPVEEELAEIWAEVLSLDHVGIHDNFLELGGHSLAATQVISRVLEKFDLELPLRILFEAPTVADMAEVILRYQNQQPDRSNQIEPRLDSPPQELTEGYRVTPTNSFIPFRKEEIDQSIPDRFEQIVAKYPDRTAVKTKTHTLTYEALNKIANQVARAILATYGEKKEPIALLLEQGGPLIAAIIGILKAGKTYVPLDPYYPQARLTFMVEDSQATLIVTNNRNFSLAHELAPAACQFANIDKLDSRLSTDNLGLSIPPDSLAWIIYTSGSTGQPKGVMQTHRNVLHEIMNYTNKAHICQDDRLVLVSSPSFADAVRTTYAALLNGAGLYPLDIKEEGLAALANWLIQQEITVYRSVPTVFRHLVSTLSEEGFPKLRFIYLGGDSVSSTDVELYKKHFSRNCILVNGIGTTESLTFRWYSIDKDTPVTTKHVPVGYEVQDKQVLLLDDAGQQMQPNCIGEIAIKSHYLSPGYWRRPDLTQTAFMLDSDGGPERIYRTGDMGVMRPDGCLEHRGRKDFQVKVRGNRIEVSEIETALLVLDTIKEAVVVGREDRTREKCLVAYIVPTDKPTPTVSALRRALLEKLPDYMIPSNYMFLDALPLTPNGKLDRKALPELGTSRPDLDTAFVMSRTPVEEELAEIWAEVLSLDHVGIHDNFLELGGHSLAATQVISRVLERFDLDLPLRILFEAPTVADMAEIIVRDQKQPSEPQ